MADVYQGAYLTVATVSGGKSNDLVREFCFILDDCISTSPLIGARLLNDAELDFTHSHSHPRHIHEQPELFTRGRIFQERLLSRRIVYCYEDEFDFQCLEASHCECEGKTTHSPCSAARKARSFLRDCQRMAMLTKTVTDQRHLAIIWMEIVQKYSNLALKKEIDVLPAIGGCAKAFSRSTGQHYVAGMWAEHLHHELLWENMCNHVKRRERV